MTARDTPANLTEALLAGPRGRRLLLEYAQIADNRARDGHTHDSFSSGVFYATYRIDMARAGAAHAVMPTTTHDGNSLRLHAVGELAGGQGRTIHPDLETVHAGAIGEYSEHINGHHGLLLLRTRHRVDDQGCDMGRIAPHGGLSRFRCTQRAVRSVPVPYSC
ncbi:hypothetical protein [Rhodococcus aetherivorans]|uniref:hypothetical protein n=1 Tax=Rhodococcus aetherivorans TaxID=191292 RepID=UPI002949B33E|nr:hypothetical protein [Rhodococcus aetherivorans]MDV6297405.1 hypothetical protein [Rhodococcus aetherivorans]